MVNADDLIPRNIYDIGVAFLCIYKDHFIFFRQDRSKIFHIQKLNVHQFPQFICAVTVDFSFVTDRRSNTIVL